MTSISDLQRTTAQTVFKDKTRADPSMASGTGIPKNAEGDQDFVDHNFYLNVEIRSDFWYLNFR